jgi:membrane fusion protein, multidrug efflux system
VDVQLDRSKVLAPFDGYVGLRDISEGAYVTPQNVLVDLQQINPIKLEFEVPEKYLSLVKNGQELTFFVSGSEQQYKARVYALSSDIAPSTRTFTVRATATNGNNQLKPGQFAKVELVTGVNESAIIVPTDAVIPVIDGKQVYVFRDGKAIGTAVTTGTRLDARVEITDGLQVGDSIIVSGLLSLTNGTPVQVNKLIKP